MAFKVIFNGTYLIFTFSCCCRLFRASDILLIWSGSCWSSASKDISAIASRDGCGETKQIGFIGNKRKDAANTLYTLILKSLWENGCNKPSQTAVSIKQKPWKLMPLLYLRLVSFVERPCLVLQLAERQLCSECKCYFLLVGGQIMLSGD